MKLIIEMNKCVRLESIKIGNEIKEVNICFYGD